MMFQAYQHYFNQKEKEGMALKTNLANSTANLPKGNQARRGYRPATSNPGFHHKERNASRSGQVFSTTHQKGSSLSGAMEITGLNREASGTKLNSKLNYSE